MIATNPRSADWFPIMIVADAGSCQSCTA